MAIQTWTASAGGTWSTAANWTAGAPASADTASINALTSVTYTVTFDPAAATIAALTLGDTGGTATLALGANALTVTDVSALAARIQSGGTVTLAGGSLIASGGGASGIAVATGGLVIGFGTLFGAIAGAGTYDAVGGVLILSGGAITATTLHVANSAAAVLDLDNSSISGGIITFLGGVGATAGTLRLGAADFSSQVLTGFSDTIANLAVSSTTTALNSIDLRGVTETSVTAAAVSGTTLTVSEGATVVATLTLSTSETGNFVYWAPDSGTGTDIFLSSVACFLAGTHILTPQGEVAVENLSVGDQVLTVAGEARPVRWLGRQTVSRVFADPLRVLPIRIRAGALDENMPARDLLISPDHALLVDDILVHAGALVNGVSIRREPNVPATFTYYHIELADHALILAENTPAETFIDNIDRLAFDNWEEHQALDDVADSWIAEMEYPRVKAHRQVPLPMRARLAERAVSFDGVSVAA